MNCIWSRNFMHINLVIWVNVLSNCVTVSCFSYSVTYTVSVIFWFSAAAAGKPPSGAYTTQVSSPTRGPVLFPAGITSVNQAASPHRTGSPTGIRYTANDSMSYIKSAPSPANGNMKSPPPTARKPSIPPQRECILCVLYIQLEVVTFNILGYYRFTGIATFHGE